MPTLIPTLLLAALAQAGTIEIRNLPQPGAFEVENKGSQISLLTRVEIQRHRDGVWTAVASNVTLDDCNAERRTECHVLKAGEKLRPMRWDGYTCNVNCGPGCKNNAYLGPGEFRAVIHSCDRKQKFVGPSFHLGKL